MPDPIIDLRTKQTIYATTKICLEITCDAAFDEARINGVRYVAAPEDPLATSTAENREPGPVVEHSNPDDRPLWQLMEEAYFKGRKPGLRERFGYAAELRVVADELKRAHASGRFIEPFHLLDALDWLRAEANRAETGK